MYTWPFEALVIAIEAGTVGDWARLTKAIRAEPWGTVARQIEDYLKYQKPYGVGPLLQRAIEQARADADTRERGIVAERVRDLVERSGLRPEEFASRIGTSRSRLSTYRTGRVVPSATLMVRMQGLCAHLDRDDGQESQG